jgi:hypothetical protein
MMQAGTTGNDLMSQLRVIASAWGAKAEKAALHARQGAMPAANGAMPAVKAGMPRCEELARRALMRIKRG